jgi:hypothetical protein
MSSWCIPTCKGWGGQQGGRGVESLCACHAAHAGLTACHSCLLTSMQNGHYAPAVTH